MPEFELICHEAEFSRHGRPVVVVADKNFGDQKMLSKCSEERAVLAAFTFADEDIHSPAGTRAPLKRTTRSTPQNSRSGVADPLPVNHTACPARPDGVVLTQAYSSSFPSSSRPPISV